MNSDKLINTIDINHFMIDEQSINLVIPGDLITSEEGFMHGHGTYKMGQSIYASLMGTVQITNKLIIVNPIKSKYSPQVGDIVVGKVTEISNKRWKVDINASFYGYLNLNAAYMTEQRKKNQQDQFNMRKIMEEGDIIVAQVQSANNDKTVNLHTRNPKYGKLQSGVFLQVPYKLVKKQKHHMIYLNQVGIIMGNNGNIWLSGFNRTAKQTDLKQMQKNKKIKDGQISSQVLNQISILHNLIKLLSWEGLQISQVLLKQIIEFINQQEIKSHEILSKDGKVKNFILQQIRQRIPKRLQQLSQNIKRN